MQGAAIFLCTALKRRSCIGSRTYHMRNAQSVVMYTYTFRVFKLSVVTIPVMICLIS